MTSQIETSGHNNTLITGNSDRKIGEIFLHLPHDPSLSEYRIIHEAHQTPRGKSLGMTSAIVNASLRGLRPH